MGCAREIFANRFAEIRNIRDNSYLKKRNAVSAAIAVMAYATWLIV